MCRSPSTNVRFPRASSMRGKERSEQLATVGNSGEADICKHLAAHFGEVFREPQQSFDDAGVERAARQQCLHLAMRKRLDEVGSERHDLESGLSQSGLE